MFYNIFHLTDPTTIHELLGLRDRISVRTQNTSGFPTVAIYILTIEATPSDQSTPTIPLQLSAMWINLRVGIVLLDGVFIKYVVKHKSAKLL